MNFPPQMICADVRGEEMEDIAWRELRRIPWIEEPDIKPYPAQRRGCLENLGPRPSTEYGERLVTRNMNCHFSLLSMEE